jgi:hypothetical protein
MYRISDSGTLTGGQAAVNGDQVILNTDISATIGASEFDFFYNNEPGTIIPPWTAKTYVLDEAIFEQGDLYYCKNAGAQATSFATHAADWSHFPRFDATVKVTDDDSFDLGASSKGFRRIYVRRAIRYGSEDRLLFSATDTRVQSPNETSYWMAENAILRGTLNGLARLNLDTGKSEVMAPNGTTKVYMDDTSVRLQIDGTSKIMVDVNNNTHNNFSKLGSAAAPGIKMVKLTGTTDAAEAGTTSIAHGLDMAKILDVSVIVYGAANRFTAGYNHPGNAGHEFNVALTATNVQITNHSTNSENILGKALTCLITYEA